MDIKSFSENTTMHGIKYVFGSGKIPLLVRVLWALILLFMFGAFFANFITSLGVYFSYDSVISVKTEQNATLELPAITICNYNMVRRSIVEKYYPELKHLLQRQFTGIQNLTADANNNYDTLKNITVNKLYSHAGHQLDDMFVQCSVKYDISINCSQYITQIFTDKAHCYTFHSNFSKDIIVINKPGSSYGLSLTLDTESHEYLAPIGLGTGFKVLAHDKSVYPRMEDKSFSVGPGQDAYVAIHKEIRKRLRKPYSKQECVDTSANGLDPYYSEERCHYRCLLDYVEDGMCDLMRLRPLTGKLCSMYHFFVTSGEKIRDYFTGKVECNCLPTCEQTYFTQRLSVIDFPNALGVEYAMSKNWKITDSAELKKRYCQIHIYYESMTQTKIEERPAVDIAGLFSNIGGQLGLYLGASLITILEFIDYTIKLCMRKCGKYQARISAAGTTKTAVILIKKY